MAALSIFIFIHSYLYANDSKKGRYCSMPKLVMRKRHNVTLYVDVHCQTCDDLRFNVFVFVEMCFSLLCLPIDDLSIVSH
jgi:hypothetical protein